MDRENIRRQYELRIRHLSRRIFLGQLALLMSGLVYGSTLIAMFIPQVPLLLVMVSMFMSGFGIAVSLAGTVHYVKRLGDLQATVNRIPFEAHNVSCPVNTPNL